MQLEMSEPLVSVVMGVHNGGNKLEDTLNSVLNQQGVDLELIVIDDGSDDNTFDILNEVAKRDNRLHFMSREKKGLTISLIEGCSIAKGKFIARQDANDISLPGRLKNQAKALLNSKDISLCSTHVRFVTEEGVTALTACTDIKENAGGLKGIIHGSTMISRKHYEAVGGYRKSFYYAQDVDLWSRLLESGRHVIIPEIYYEALLFSNSISGSRKKEQERFFSYILSATKSRQEGQSEEVWLKKAERYSEKCKTSKSSPRKVANGAYFIGACLCQQNPSLAKKYFGLAIKNDPTHLRARIKLATLR
jgi:glycosyltransferase involved in cell wall biosynthesis